MGKKYKNPPVVETLCEFKFIPDRPWDLTIPGLIYEKVKRKFPDRKQQTGIGVQFKATEKGLEHKVEPAPPRVQFYKKDKTALIQIAPDILAINQLKPYSTWNKFKLMILEGFKVYKEIVNPKGFRRVGLRYINIMEFDKTVIELKDYFQYYPFIPNDMPQLRGSFLTRVEFPCEEGNENLILTLSSLTPKKPDMISILLDIDYAMVVPEYISFEQISEWLDKAHEKVENAFEASITNKAREIFKEENHDTAIKI
ncbi:MAG: TIGR04255 family protein [Thermotogae bacterium]|nr:TIGR04255 family protein [Thermotogota bacterium]